MNLLALDTSTESCSVALLRGDALAFREVRAGQRHSELILPMIAELLAEVDFKLARLDGIAFGAGPGSFTGLRIACGVAQGLALGAGLPVVPVGTLAALAEESGAERALACIDARMGELYHAAYQRSGGEWTQVAPPAVGNVASLPMLDGEGWVGCGSGFLAHGPGIERRYGAQLARVEADLHPHARAIARLAKPVLLAGGGLAAEQAMPLYVRDKVALKMHEQR
ncbi:MAG TPA: tRNA (adenosine(37)-N6)-threonylcarbamoyltransferase complex dimerization subunit type 1 TsaB [Burkholderiales bacterium]|nr:tRNA (adenosine(37)-N6)-threonylcarbamoyltransferase complex dimerization subunit type 1 TsaB [Burkholderiales bacterium]